MGTHKHTDVIIIIYDFQREYNVGYIDKYQEYYLDENTNATFQKYSICISFKRLFHLSTKYLFKYLLSKEGVCEM